MYREILEKRKCGKLKIQMVKNLSNTLANALVELGFKVDESKTYKIDRLTALEIITSILWKDLAYEVEIINYEDAHHNAQMILDDLSGNNSDFFTNGNWIKNNNTFVLESWHHFTNATFDTGVIILNPRQCGCIWVEDED